MRILTAMLCAATLAAQEAKPVRVIVPARRVGIMTEAQLSLDEAVALTLSNNRDIDNSRIDRQIASVRLTGARGLFDPRFGADGSLARSITPVGSALGGGAIPGQLKNVNMVATPSLSGLIPRYGSNYNVSLANNRTSTDNLFSTLNPQFPTNLSISLTQPLLRNLRFDETRRQVEVAKKNTSITDEQFRQRVIEIATQAVNAYWDLVFAYRNYQIQLEAVDLARRQVESNQRQVTQGILAPIDINEAETLLDQFEQNLYTAQQSLTRSENALKILMLQDRSAVLWNSALIPTTPLQLQPPVLILEDAVRQAIESRPELAQVRLNADVNQTNTRFFRDQTKPQVDVVGAYSSAGLAGEQISGGFNPFAGNSATTDRINQLSRLAGLQPLPATTAAGVPGALLGTYGQSLSNLWGFNYSTANIGVRVSLPLHNRVAESNLAATVADGRRIDNQRAQLEMRVEADVRDTLQTIESTRSRTDAATFARQTAEAQYQSEQRKFQEGTSTVFLVVQRQTAMITSRNAELRAQTDLSRAIAEFERATTRTLASRNINIQSATAPRKNP